MADIGELVASYRLTELIGGGGMGTIYRAHDERLQRDVALKLLAPQLSEDASFRARFEREARIAGGLRHPNIVPVFDAGEWNGQLYLAMMLVEGPDLAKVIKRDAPLALARVTGIVEQVASALDAAHAHGIVHRDVKPGNVLLLEHGAPDGDDYAYLADFGLTRSTGLTQMTRAGTFLGTLDYIAPEQLEGDHVDGRADQYSLACTVFETLSATPPFKRESELALISAHLYSPPPVLADVRPDLPPGLGLVIARAMAKDPAARYPSCGAFADAIDQAATGAAPSAATMVADSAMAATVAASRAATNVALAGEPTVVSAAPPVPPASPNQGVVLGGAPPAPKGDNSRPLAIALAVVLLVVLIGISAVLAINLLGSQPSTQAPGTGALPTQFVAGAPSTQPTEVTGVPTNAVLVPTLPPTPPPIPGLTLPPVPWAILISASATSVPVSQPVTIRAVVNADVASAGFVIEISNLSTGKTFNMCSSGTTCQTVGASGVPRITTYLATVGPPAGPAVAQATTTVIWSLVPATPTPSLSPPVTPTPPGGVGPSLAAGIWSVVHTLSGVVYGSPDYQPTTISRTYTLSTFSCLTDSDCTDKFLTNDGITVVYHWNGSSFHYGPRTYNQGHTCSGSSGAYTVSQEVDVSPVGWDGVSPISQMAGQMRLTGTATPSGTVLGCSDWQLLYNTDISHL